jgi:hypothetical protein
MRRLIEGFLLACVLFASSPTQVNPYTQLRPPFPNSAVFSTHDQVHAGENTCYLTSAGITAFSCTLIGPNGGKQLAGYTFLMPLFIVPDVACAQTQGCTVNVDNVSIVTLKASDGTTGVTMLAGHGYWFFYNAHGVFQLTG